MDNVLFHDGDVAFDYVQQLYLIVPHKADILGYFDIPLEYCLEAAQCEHVVDSYDRRGPLLPLQYALGQRVGAFFCKIVKEYIAFCIGNAHAFMGQPVAVYTVYGKLEFFITAQYDDIAVAFV